MVELLPVAQIMRVQFPLDTPPGVSDGRSAVCKTDVSRHDWFDSSTRDGAKTEGSIPFCLGSTASASALAQVRYTGLNSSMVERRLMVLCPNGQGAACKADEAGSIPARASNPTWSNGYDTTLRTLRSRFDSWRGDNGRCISRQGPDGFDSRWCKSGLDIPDAGAHRAS